jgi:hypothetical protein
MYLKGKFVLILVSETPHFGHNIAKIVLNKQYGGAEASTYGFFVLVWGFVTVITATIKTIHLNHRIPGYRKYKEITHHIVLLL